MNLFPLLFYYLPASGVTGGRTTAIDRMTSACSRGFTFLRVSGSLYWPSQMNSSYIAYPEAYWAAYDTMVADARSCGCRLMPSLFWNAFMFADLSGEPLGTGVRDPTSFTSQAMHRYAAELVSRYAANDTIAAWEFGNEWNLLLDLDMEGSTDGSAPSLGTPASRTRADNVSTDDWMTFAAGIVATIRDHDTLKRPISSGHAVVRSCAEHLRASYHAPQRDWGADSLQQFMQVRGGVPWCVYAFE